MKKTFGLFMLLIISSVGFSQKPSTSGNNQSNETKTSGNKEQETQVHITPGSSGVKRSIGYKFSSLHTDADPGNGKFRFDKETVSEIKFFYVDNVDIAGENQTSWYSTWDQTTGATGRGRITVADRSGKVISVFDVTAVFVDGNGYWKFPVEYLSGKSPVNDSIYYYVFERIAHGESSANKGNESNDTHEGNGGNEGKEGKEGTGGNDRNGGNGGNGGNEGQEGKEGNQVTAVVSVTPTIPPAVTVTTTIPVTPPVVVTPPTEITPTVTVTPTVPVTPPVVVTPPTEITPAVTVTPAVPVTPPVVVTPPTEITPAVTVTPAVPVTPPVVVTPPTEITPAVTVTPAVPVTPPVVVTPPTEITPAVTVTTEVPDEPSVTVASRDNIRKEKETARQTEVFQTPEVVTEKPAEDVKQVVRETNVTQPTQNTQVAQRVPGKIDKEPDQVVPVSQTTHSSPAKPVTQQTTRPTPAKPATQQTTQTTPSKPVTQQTTQTTPAKPVAQPAQQQPVAQTTPVYQPSQGNQFPQSYPEPQRTQEAPVSQRPQSTPANQGNQSTRVAQTNPATQTQRDVQVNQPVLTQDKPYVPSNGGFVITDENPGSVSTAHKKWFRGIIEGGYAFGLGDYGINNFRLNFIPGFRIGRFSSVGLGIGYRRMFTQNTTSPFLVSAKSQIPVFIDFRTTFSSKRVTPYLALDLGNSFGQRTSGFANEGLLFSGSGGIWLNVSDRFAVFAGLAYESSKMEFSNTNPFTANYKKNAGSISLNIGISF